MEVVTFISYILSNLLWAVIGFICWIPLLVRAIGVISGTVLYCNFTGSDPSKIKTILENAVTFYSRGFQVINQAFWPDHKDRVIDSQPSQEQKPTLWHVGLEILWVVVFWA